MKPHSMRRHRLLVALCAAGPLLAQAAGASSPFNSGDEGWTAQGDFSGAPVTWRATGGNPGGHIEIVDAVLGGVTYFVAPVKFLGNQAGAFGLTLSFDLQQQISGGPNQFDSPDVQLVGGALTLVYDTTVNPAFNAWTHYSVPLIGAGWRVGTLTGVAATNANMAAVLGNLSALLIRAEYQTGPDTGFLDNVVLAAVPEPGAAALWLAGLAAAAWVARRRDRR